MWSVLLFTSRLWNVYSMKLAGDIMPVPISLSISIVECPFEGINGLATSLFERVTELSFNCISLPDAFFSKLNLTFGSVFDLAWFCAVLVLVIRLYFCFCAFTRFFICAFIRFFIAEP